MDQGQRVGRTLLSQVVGTDRMQMVILVQPGLHCQILDQNKKQSKVYNFFISSVIVTDRAD